MKKFLLLISVLLLLITGCTGSDTEQKQHSIFPLPCKTRSRAYYVDENGKEIESITQTLESLGADRWYEPTFAQDGLIRVDIKVDGNRVFKFIDADGKEVLDVMAVSNQLYDHLQEYAKCTDFSQGVAFIENLGKCYAIDKQGKMLFEFDGTPISAFGEDGLAYFKDNQTGYIGIMDKSGKIVVEARKDIVASNTPPVKGTFCVRVENSKMALCDLKGNVTPPIGNRISPLDANDCVTFVSSDGYGVCDRSGKILFQRKNYDEFENDGKLYYFRNNDGEVGWCDKNGEVKIGPLSESSLQAEHARYYWYPRPFYGSDRSVGTVTSLDSERNYLFDSAAASVKELNEMAEYKEYEPALIRCHEVGVMFISPVINGRVIGYNKYQKTHMVYKVEGNKIIEIESNGFSPKYDYWSLHLYGMYCLNPAVLWQGLH